MAKTGSNRPLGDRVTHSFGPYELVRRLGVGGMAETYEAIRRGPGGFAQRVCLKLIQPFYRNRTDFIELFEREARLAAQLRHSNIVGVLDFGRIEGVTYMALELVDGIDLAALLDAQPGRRVSPEHVALLGHQLAQALEHAHDPRRDDELGSADKTIIHRDISPSNIMVSKSAEVLLTDFGVAKAVAGTARQQSAVKGKVPYMSPEQLRDEPLDGRADLFALGVVLFEAMAGERPFCGEHDPSTIMKILRGDRPSLQSVAPNAPAALCDVIESLLEVERAKRPPNATALIELLDPFLPSSQVRRELGALASEARARKLASLEEGVLPDSNETSGVSRTSGPLAPGMQGTPTTTSEEVPKRRRSLLWALAAVIAIGAALVQLPLDGGETADPGPLVETAAPDLAAPPAAPAPANTPTPAPGGEDPPGTEATAEPAPTEGSDETKEPAKAPARLEVFVFPWGDVWINGKRYGAAPLERVVLEPGRYRISAGQGEPSRTKRIVLREGERRTVQFDLTR